jgi:hypothetical protein
VQALKSRSRPGISEAKNRNPISFRVSDELRRRLDLRARASGRTLSAEIETLLELAMAEEERTARTWVRTYGQGAAAFLYLAAEIARGYGEDWPLDPLACRDVRTKLDHLLALLEGETRATIHSPLYRFLWRLFGPRPRPGDARVAEWLRECLSDRAIQRLTPHEGLDRDD